jgi:hypothetical protein
MNITKNKKLIIIILSAMLILFILISLFPKKEKNTSSNFTKSTQTTEQTVVVERNVTENTLGDFLFAQNSKEFYRTHPWYRSLPIETQGYLILWDFNKEQFAIQLKIKEDASPNEKGTLTSQAVQEIKNITKNEFDKYEYYILYLK